MSKQYFTGEETISYILMDLPESYEIFASYGLACAGCPVAPMEELKDGAKSHGINDETFKQLLEDLNEMKEEKDSPLFYRFDSGLGGIEYQLYFTDAVVVKLKELGID